MQAQFVVDTTTTAVADAPVVREAAWWAETAKAAPAKYFIKSRQRLSKLLKTQIKILASLNQFLPRLHF
jgi:hypothetical protein